MTYLKNQLDEDSEMDAEPPCPVSCNVQNTERLNMKAFSNGDFYVGDIKEVLPHGKGKYTWSDGTVYDGDWEGGKMTGKGVILWPSGEKYNGDISGGYLHGSGMLTSPDGSLYKGKWRMNRHHGYGRKKYSNSDVYEGEWKEGEPEGNGRYFWNNGNKHTGNWKRGKMHGRGVMEWGNGDQYNGCWLNGFKHGSGIYQYADGGYYFGTWTRGLKDGKGERAVKKPSVKRSFSEKISVTGVLRSSGRLSHKSFESSSHSGSTREFVRHNSSGTFSLGSDAGQSVVQENAAIVYEREYMQGVMIKERVRDYTELSQKAEKKTKRHAKETEKISCVAIFKGKNSYHLMLNLQLGIRYTVGKITPVPKREVRNADFGDRARITMFFPRRGSHFTPPHKSIDFYWKDYCPMVFRNLREMFKLDAAEYMMSICGDDGLTEISSPGKSGSIFYLSHDDKFVIKTLKKSELKIIDYSILLGLHFRAPEQLNGHLGPPNIESSQSDQGLTTEGEVLFPSKGLLLVAHEPSSVNTEPGPHIRGRPLRAFSLGDREVDVLVPGTGRLQVQLGVNMPAQASQKLCRDEADSAEAELFEVYDVVVYMGIIDILQEYNVKKKAEHAYKSVKFDPLSISVVEPQHYAQRFIDFLQKKVFPEQP
ncbi:Phosphatidylinositol 4-phosphate 5-kinase 8 [Hibiscus syriacus]|uniref:1-phosphatidylinositol-4-phosphate 5-kinase n=1 Tax=Hibiscus syriacus TaxID=106335 RepID=A0A6A3BIQ9_HIBSY|nr:Phosphatidylinositol 4-phosphate 5-kinase 8 [Hibiscus syriacus]